MRCKRCGKDIGTTRKCPFCGTEQHYIDPFTTLGDIEPNKGYENMDDRVNDQVIPSAKMDYFSALGDLEPSGDYFDEVYYTNSTPEGNCIDSFHPVGNLDGFDTLVNDFDAPAKGGFKPMDELIPSTEVLDTPEQTDLPIKPVDPKTRIAFAWKKWIVIAASAVAVITVLLLFGLSTREKAYEVAIAEKIASEMIQGEKLPLAYQYNNAVLNAIGFRILDTDKSTNTAMVKFSYIDILSLADTYVGSMSDSSLFYTHCIDQIESGKAPTLTKTITVSFAVFESGEVEKLIALDSVDFADVLTGGVASAYVKLSGGD